MSCQRKSEVVLRGLVVLLLAFEVEIEEAACGAELWRCCRHLRSSCIEVGLDREVRGVEEILQGAVALGFRE